MYVRKVQTRTRYQTTPFMLFETQFGNFSAPLIFQPKYLPQPQTSSASLIFITTLSTICGLTTVISLFTLCIWCRKKNSVFPMNKSEMPPYYSSAATITTEYDDISQTTEVIENLESCLSTIRKGIPKRPVTFCLSSGSSVSYYRSLDMSEQQQPPTSYANLADDLITIDSTGATNPEKYSLMQTFSVEIDPKDGEIEKKKP